MISTFVSYGLHYNIREPNRVTVNSSSCLDNAVTNMKPDMYELTIFDPDISDHYAQYMVIKEYQLKTTHSM